MAPVDPQARLLALTRDYAARLPERVAELQEAGAALARRWDPVTADGLRRALHNLAGSGGSYGFATVSQHARRAELMVAALGPEAPPAEALASLAAELELLAGLAREAAAG